MENASRISRKAFADDLKTYTAVDNFEDCNKFQLYLDKLNTWSKEWQIALAPSKCAALSFSGNSEVLNFNYMIDGIIIPKVNSIVDLGIEFTSTLNFLPDITNIYRKAFYSSLVMYRCFNSKDKILLYNAFSTYVRPLLEYCTSLWSPYKLCEIRQIESVQKKFTKRLQGLEQLSYQERLHLLKAESLELRRLKSDLTMIYKILHKYVAIESSEFFTIKSNQITRGHSLMIVKKPFKYNLEKYALKNRCTDLWNKLPSHIVNAANVKSFKKLINKLPIKYFDKYVFIK